MPRSESRFAQKNNADPKQCLFLLIPFFGETHPSPKNSTCNSTFLYPIYPKVPTHSYPQLTMNILTTFLSIYNFPLIFSQPGYTGTVQEALQTSVPILRNFPWSYLPKCGLALSLVPDLVDYENLLVLVLPHLQFHRLPGVALLRISIIMQICERNTLRGLLPKPISPSRRNDFSPPMIYQYSLVCTTKLYRY